MKNFLFKSICYICLSLLIAGCTATTNNNQLSTPKQNKIEKNNQLEKSKEAKKEEAKKEEAKKEDVKKEDVKKVKKEKKEKEKIKKEQQKPIKVEKKKPKQKVKIIIKKVEVPIKSSKIIIGQKEYVYIPSEDITLKARIDTGATTTSINALNIKGIERDGKKWVKFDLEDEKGKLIHKSLPISRLVKIKRHGTKYQRRYVVKMKLTIGKTTQLVDVSLTDRSKFKYPLLLGRNYLNGIMIVDVSKEYTTKPKKK
ncbi:ATP-dependent zinc protease [Arcobacter sp. CECT 8985]|uniref:ATP-dependent zinc protease family protein n=1 Tax=Arcobacter sp. CECT 8985 TaxID=1935424 RepID=UPI00100BFC89|nr:ATP-dependent zinc protease [Arcobacter sp. CECT 8985]RXJ86454.1 ATP-dependent Zn protease [Arcobacter sp. CECT 8985]